MVTKVISTRIDEVLIERFDEKAAAANITRNELIAKLISD
ncbi:MAG: ribbon-helix-helix protein, CopG family, partial [Pseudanabaena sp. M110S1SP2A07QC]|nr:ribbon-helix-helix protein, CopG family [Pseudanabaena sp. M110S1SP2A07QC]